MSWVQKWVRLLQITLRHLLRSRFIVLTVVFSCIALAILLKGSHSLVFSLNGVRQILSPEDIVKWLLLLILGLGGSITFIYGVWFVPYLHSGAREQLTYVLPVSRWSFPTVYVATLSLLVGLLMVVGLGMFFYFYKSDIATFPWKFFFVGCGLELLAFSVMVLLMGLFSLGLGKLQAFLIGPFLVFMLVVLGGVCRSQYFLNWQEESLWAKVAGWCYRAMPPFGELIWKTQAWHWFIWLVLLSFCFQLRLRRPVLGKVSE